MSRIIIFVLKYQEYELGFLAKKLLLRIYFHYCFMFKNKTIYYEHCTGQWFEIEKFQTI